MDSDNLIRMANQIGAFFDSMPDRSEAVQGVANHLQKFWDPRMRVQFLQMVDSGHEEQVSAIVREAVQRYRALIVPAG